MKRIRMAKAIPILYLATIDLDSVWSFGYATRQELLGEMTNSEGEGSLVQ